MTSTNLQERPVSAYSSALLALSWEHLRRREVSPMPFPSSLALVFLRLFPTLASSPSLTYCISPGNGSGCVLTSTIKVPREENGSSDGYFLHSPWSAGQPHRTFKINTSSTLWQDLWPKLWHGEWIKEELGKESLRTCLWEMGTFMGCHYGQHGDWQSQNWLGWPGHHGDTLSTSLQWLLPTMVVQVPECAVLLIIPRMLHLWVGT